MPRLVGYPLRMDGGQDDAIVRHATPVRQRDSAQPRDAGRRERSPRFHRTHSSHLLHALGDWSEKSAAGVAVASVLAGWAAVGIATGFPHWWEVALYSSTSAVTVVMVFAVQHTQHRQQLVTQGKLDELLRAQPDARNSMIAAEAVADEDLDDLVGTGPASPAATAGALDDQQTHG